jgi:DNA-binding transcriptional regulator YiaG
LLDWARVNTKGEASMAKPAPNKSPAKRKAKRAAKPAIDPRQMGLFDALETLPAAPARMPRAHAAKAQAVRTGAPERPVVLSPGEAAQYLGVSVSTLKNWRAKKIGPKWTLRGARLVAYRPADLEKYLDDNSAKR